MTKSFREVIRKPEFEKDLKKLRKRFPSLEEDLQSCIDVQLYTFHKHQVDNHGIEPIAGLRIATPHIFKVRKFACKYLKRKGVQSGIRIIYAYFPNADRIELVEMYYKGDQENENRERIESLYR